MKKFNKRLAVLLVPLMLLGGCQDKDYGPDAESITLEDAVNPVSYFAAGDNSHLNEAASKTTMVRFHYHRMDDTTNSRSPYKDFGVWAWDMTNSGNGAFYPFTNYDKFGVYCDIELSAISGGKAMSKVGFIITTEDWTKDYDSDRDFDVADLSNGGIQDLYLRSKESTIFYSQDNALKATINYASLKSFTEVNVYFKPVNSKNFSTYKKRFSVKINGEPYTDYTVGEYDSSTKCTALTFKDELDIKDSIDICYKFDDQWTNESPLVIANYFDTTEFNNNYSYDGDDLGATFNDVNNPTKTNFKVWAPTSTSVKLNVYATGNYETDVTAEATYDMTLGDKGVFSYQVNDNLDGKYYTYTVTNAKGTNEVVDPYAKSTGINGRRGMVVDFNKIDGELAGWSTDSRPNYGDNAVDASIYEIHVRDMTINPNSGVSADHRGKFLGLTETGTTYTNDGVTVTTGLDHLKELGVSHVQIQPLYDYSSVDEATSSTEMSTSNYNWGYDPLNYNTLEGSYSTNPSDGYNRIKEFKQMVMAMHESGLNINMDVVYNHTSSSEQSNFNKLVPYYYYRTQPSGQFYNGSGCGNEVASNRYMVNKFIRESCKFWVDEYHLSGFRFDLMGLLDNQTMIDVYQDCKALYSNIMVYGEPWTGGTSKLKSGTDSTKLTSQQTVQSSLAQSYFAGNNVLVGAFNDVIRNAVRGDNNPSRGYVQGLIANASSIFPGIQGMFNSSQSTINPNQVINYVSCHDNYTLYDQLVQTMGSLNDAYTEAESIVFLSEGVPFMQEGEDFMRSKYNDGVYQHNSYNTGDYDNDMDYELKASKVSTFNKFKELIAFRKANNEFRLSTRNDINYQLTNLTNNAGLISYNLGDNLIVAHTVNAKDLTFDGNYEVVYSNVLDASAYTSFTGTYSLKAHESVVLKKVAA